MLRKRAAYDHKERNLALVGYTVGAVYTSMTGFRAPETQGGARRGRGESAHEAASGVKQGKGGVFGSAVNKGFRTAAFRFV